MANEENLKPFKKGYDKRRENNGRPKSKTKSLIKLIKDIAKIKHKLEGREKRLAYDLYEIAIADLSLKNIDSDVRDLYFMKSDFGIKIGVSKRVDKRLIEVKRYAPSVEIYKVIKNGGAFEANLHKKFKKHNIKNNPIYGVEWFYTNDDLLNFIDEIDNVTDLVSEFGTKQAVQLQLNWG